MANTLRLLSQLYQGLPPLDPPPCYEMPPLKPVDSLVYAKYPPETMPTFMNDKPFPYGGTPHLMGKNKGNVLQIVLHLSGSLIAELQRAVNTRAKANGQTSVLSKQDVLLALLARAYSISDPRNPIVYLISIFNVCCLTTLFARRVTRCRNDSIEVPVLSLQQRPATPSFPPLAIHSNTIRPKTILSQ